jgi:hypothetical protein
MYPCPTLGGKNQERARDALRDTRRGTVQRRGWGFARAEWRVCKTGKKTGKIGDAEKSHHARTSPIFSVAQGHLVPLGKRLHVAEKSCARSVIRSCAVRSASGCTLAPRTAATFSKTPFDGQTPPHLPLLTFWRFGVLAFWRFGVLAFWRLIPSGALRDARWGTTSQLTVGWVPEIDAEG